MAVSGLVWLKIRKSGRVDPRWLLALSALDVACLAFTLSMSGGFGSRYFPLYYFAVAVSAWLFTSPYLAFSWTTMVVVTYVAVCLVAGDGVDLAQQDEKVIFYRVLGMYGVGLSVNLLYRFERIRGLRTVERELNRQRIEISQTIHDTTAQSAYLLGLGLEQAIEMSERSDPELTGKLEAMSELSKSTMWALRHPIDGGEIFSGGTLSEVLTGHVDTFTVITSIPTSLEQRGSEPQLSTMARSRLFSIAHNALTNVLRHSRSGRVSPSFWNSSRKACACRCRTTEPGFRRITPGGATVSETWRPMPSVWVELSSVQSNEDGTTVSCTPCRISGKKEVFRCQPEPGSGWLSWMTTPSFREGIAEVLSQSGEFEVVGQAGDGDQAVTVVAELRPDVVIMDILMPGKNGIGSLPGDSGSRAGYAGADADRVEQSGRHRGVGGCGCHRVPAEVLQSGHAAFDGAGGCQRRVSGAGRGGQATARGPGPGYRSHPAERPGPADGA